MQTLLKNCKNLKFEEDPNYLFIKEQLKAMFTTGGFIYDMNYDWTAHAAAIEKKSTFLHLADRQNQLAKRNSVKKNLGDQSATEDKKEDWKTSKIMKQSAPQLLRSPNGEQNSMMVNYTSGIQEASSKGQEHIINPHLQGELTKGTENNNNIQPGIQMPDKNNEKEKKKCCCLLL